MTKEDVIGWLEFLKEQEHAKADSIIPCSTEIALGMAIEALKQPEIVRCKDCIKKHDPLNCQLCSEGIYPPDNWFCADGEREDEKKNV